MDVQIKTEQIYDQSAITDVICETFYRWHPNNWYVSKPVMANLPEQGKTNNSHLPLIAEIAGNGSGHILFSIYQFIVAGTAQQGAVPASAVLKPNFPKKAAGVIPMFVGKPFMQDSTRVHAA